ncbi:hypothetical protein ACN47E_008308 [Coniothyrium glycines]
MAPHTYAPSPMLNPGNHHQDRRLIHNSTTSVRRGEQRIPTKDSTPNTTALTGGRGDEQSALEDAANGDDDEDSSTAQDDDKTDEDDTPAVPAPSYGQGKGGKGKGKRPAIRVEPADGNDSQDEHRETADVVTGLMTSRHPLKHPRMNNKKRTFSNLSSTSVLFGDDSTDQEIFPRRKIARKLSNVAAKPLLTYQEGEEIHENAIESDDDDDDDEDYSGVNLVPEEDDLEMEEQEESYILQEEQQATTLLNQFRDARRLSLDHTASDNIFGVSGPLDDAFISSLPDFGFAQFFEPEALPDSPLPAAKRRISDSSTKRVRFEDEVKVSDSSDSESSELDSSVFPDLFLEQDKLPPILHQLMEFDPDDDDEDLGSPMSDGSFWDFGPEEARITQADDDTDDESSGESSGYESDMGDTTDEEEYATDARPVTPVQKQSVLQQPASTPGSRAGTPKPFERNSRSTGRHIPPMRGVFQHTEHNEAIAVTNKSTKTVTFYRPRTKMIPWIPMSGYHSSTSSTANNSPRNSIAQLNAAGSDSEVSNEVFNNTVGTDIMLSGIFGSAPGNDYFFGTESIGPPEAFYPFVSIGSNGNMFENMDDYGDDDSEDYEDDLNITDFMDFGSDGDDSDFEQEDDIEDTDVPATPSTSTIAHNDSTPAPMSSTPGNRKRTTSDVMLEHFDRGVVTAFRNNQNRYRDVASLPSDPAARASVSRPVRSGKSAEALITPLRKRNRQNRIAKSPLKAVSTMHHSSPLAGVSKAATRLQNSMMSPPRRPPPRMGTFS